MTAIFFQNYLFQVKPDRLIFFKFSTMKTMFPGSFKFWRRSTSEDLVFAQPTLPDDVDMMVIDGAYLVHATTSKHPTLGY